MIKKEFSKIINLTKIMLKDSYQNPYIINPETGKINKRSPFVWMMIILCGVMSYISYYIINFLQKVNQPTIFLNVYFLILTFMMTFQVILMCTNVFYYSKDMEKLLHFPIKPVELLLAKLGNLLCIVYVTELLFAFIPFILYGIITNVSIIYYLYLILILIFAPILIASLVSIVMMFFMKLTRFIKSKETFQVIVTAILLIIMFVIESLSVQNLQYDENLNLETQEQITSYVNERMEGLNKYLIPSKLSVGALSNASSLDSFYNILELIFISLIILALFIFTGKITYLKNILKGTNYFTKKKHKKLKENKINANNKVWKVYISKEFKNLYRNVAFLLQCIWPVFVWLICIIILSIVLIPNINQMLSNEEFVQNLGESILDIQIITMILCLLQVIFSISNLSITSVSRDGKNAIFMKYIPIDLYKQVWYKAIPQIILNIVISIFIITVLTVLINKIKVTWAIAIFIISIFINIINSLLMVLVDLRRPNLNWNTEYQLVKQNSNKIFQYILMITIILLLLYLTSVFQNFNLNLTVSIIVLVVLFGAIVFGISKYIKKKQDKIFKNIF